MISLFKFFFPLFPLSVSLFYKYKFFNLLLNSSTRDSCIDSSYDGGTARDSATAE
jgi:hypothetical protein